VRYVEAREGHTRGERAQPAMRRTLVGHRSRSRWKIPFSPLDVVLLFVCAVSTHIRASDYSVQFGLGRRVLLLAVAALVLNLAVLPSAERVRRSGWPSLPGWAKLGTYPVGIRVVEFVEDSQSASPGRASCVGRARGVVGIAEVDQRIGFAPAVARRTAQADGTPVTGDRFAVLAEMNVGVAQAVPGRGRAGTVAELLLESQRLLAADESVPVLAQFGLVPTDVVERVGLSGSVAGDPEQLQCPLGVV